MNSFFSCQNGRPARISRRGFLQTAGAAAAGIAAGLPARGAGVSIEVLDTRVISPDTACYHGWPTVARRRNGQLAVVWSGGREGHICPFGRVEIMTSNDEGGAWTWPRVLIDGAIDDRDAGVIETARGTLLAAYFTSLAYEAGLRAAEQKKPGEKGAWPADRLKRWQAAHQRTSAKERQAELGCWMIRSTDGGLTWSPRYSTGVSSPHGPFELGDGRLFYAGVELWSKERRAGVCESTDDGATWRWLAPIPARPGDSTAEYHEFHGVETADGRILVHIRNHNKTNPNETLQTESADGGKTWSAPKAIGVLGLPSHLLKLRDGRLLMSYGYRHDPAGNQARVSADQGRSWSAPLVISSDSPSWDVGYPSTVELSGGVLLTVWYEALKGSSRAVLRQARWVLKG